MYLIKYIKIKNIMLILHKIKFCSSTTFTQKSAVYALQQNV